MEICPRRVLAESRLLPLAEHVIRALAVAGVLTTGQLDQICGIAPRTLRKYHSLYFVDRIPILTEELMARGLSKHAKDLRLYKLGPVGKQIAKRVMRSPSAVGYEGYGTNRILHDVLTNETVLRLSRMARDEGFEPIWLSKYEATVHDTRGAPALEPDAMLSLSNEGRALHFFVEFHNEDSARRAAMKVNHYEQTYRDGRWRQELMLDDMPTVLCVFAARAVGKGYQEAVARAKRLGLRCLFLGKSWDDLVSSSHEELGQWWSFAEERTVDLLER